MNANESESEWIWRPGDEVDILDLDIEVTKPGEPISWDRSFNLDYSTIDFSDFAEISNGKQLLDELDGIVIADGFEFYRLFTKNEFGLYTNVILIID